MSTWQNILKSHPEANFAQSPAWAKMHELIGDKVITKFFDSQSYALMIVRDAKRGRYLEIPCGPLIDWQNDQLVAKVFTEIRQIALENHCVFIRFRPQLFNTPENLTKLAQLGTRISPMHLAAEHTVILNLEKSEDELLADMRRQTRYEVRRADKLGITVEKSNDEAAFQEFHQIQLDTAHRQNFIPPSLTTLLAEKEAFGDNAIIYKAMVRCSEGNPQLRRGLSDEPRNDGSEERPEEHLAIAYGLILSDGAEAVYYEAASTELNRKLPGAYALIWQAMKDLKKQGIKRFNLWGIAPPNQPNHRYAGVTTFKTGFGDGVVEYVPAHDIVLSRPKYLKNLIVETIRKKRRHL